MPKESGMYLTLESAAIEKFTPQHLHLIPDFSFLVVGFIMLPLARTRLCFYTHELIQVCISVNFSGVIVFVSLGS